MPSACSAKCSSCGLPTPSGAGALHQMHHRQIAAIVPGTAEAEGRPVAGRQPQHLVVEGAHGRQVGGLDVHVVEFDERHARCPQLCSVPMASRLTQHRRCWPRGRKAVFRRLPTVLHRVAGAWRRRRQMPRSRPTGCGAFGEETMRLATLLGGRAACRLEFGGRRPGRRMRMAAWASS